MLRCATLACGLALAGSYRVVSKGDVRPFSSEVLVNDTQLAQFSENLIDNINPTLKALNVDPEAIGVAFFNGIADFDFNGDLLEQMRDLATSSAINLAKTIVSSIHPLLGVVFSVFASMFGWGGADTDGEFVKQILEQVDQMIKVSMRDFGRKLVQEELSGVLESINAAGSNETRWGHVPLTMASSFPKVFKSCWNDEGSSDCKKYRTSEGGAAALMMELQFTYLMIASGVTVARYGHELGSYADSINKAALLTETHFHVFANYRTNFASSESGVRKGRVNCTNDNSRDPKQNRKCRTDNSTDLLLNRGFCGIAESKCSNGRCGDDKARWNKDLDTCFLNYQQEIRTDLAKLFRETKAVTIASTKMLQWSRTRKLDCAEGYELKLGDIGGRGKIDGVGGGQEVNDCNECANLCTGIAACLSYECSPFPSLCNLNTQRDPTDPQWGEWVFCSTINFKAATSRPAQFGTAFPVVACGYPGHSTNPTCTLPTRGHCIGRVRYGKDNKWTAWKEASGQFLCDMSFFNQDPYHNMAKECECDSHSNHNQLYRKT